MALPQLAPWNEPDPQTVHQVSRSLIARSYLEYVESVLRIRVELPLGRVLTAFGNSYHEASARFYEEVSNFAEAEASEELIAWLIKNPVTQERQRTATKSLQKTIGVYSKTSLIDLIIKEGDRSATARDLFAKGFRALDKRLDSEDSKDVFASFQAAYDALPVSPNQQWSLRLDPKAYGRAVVRAGEYGCSASNLAALCLAYALSSFSA